MVSDTQNQQQMSRRGLVVGNYCHDVLVKNDVVVAETLGGAASFISAVLDGLSIDCDYASKVGSDFKYSHNLINHRPIVVRDSLTTVFRAEFDDSSPSRDGVDRILKRITACESIAAADLPDSRRDFGMAVGVGGEVIPETLVKMLDTCDLVFVDIQALIRVFDSVDGTVKLVRLNDTGFFHLLPRIGVLKASAEEACYVDVEEARKWCCVVVTNGKDGCTVYWKDGELQVPPFCAVQVDPTGAGDSFLGGFVAGLVQGLSVPDAALLGNFFGSLTVAQVGYPKFDSSLLQRVKDEVQRRKVQCESYPERRDSFTLTTKPLGYEQFHASLCAAKLLTQKDVRNPPRALEQSFHSPCPDQQVYT